ncbi:hypothetical protein FA15DRAFT_665085 [Coprinopsis marcescibilis]|uniref:F-box domain-containing protein n=1 Tax=Coprinopsis marcescibilis TaxID=230819 RepID=A0A5C3LJ90_COPMA|nr:hypothetical protein FA15DRAFT_665085 [Coprinopsis marcescibilis]
MASRNPPLPVSLPLCHQITLARRSSTILSPSSIFDGLPLEIQAEIFSYCLPAFPQLGRLKNDPMPIARVCRTWRALAQSTPKLWSSFEIVVKDSVAGTSGDIVGSPYASRLLNTAKLWLERSRNHPLSIRLIHTPKARVPSQLSAGLLAIFIRQARRFHRIELNVPTVTMSAVHHLFPQYFPILVSLTLKTAHSSWQAAVSFDFQAMKFPWAQLTDLDLRLDHGHILNLDDYANILSGAINLVACKINAGFVPKQTSMWPFEDHSPFLLPSLKTLHVAFQGTNAVDTQVVPNPQQRFQTPEVALTSFLGLFSGCQLRELCLNWLVDGRGVEHWSPACNGAFEAFLKGQSTSLRSLELTYLPLGEDHLKRCLEHLQIEQLRLCFSVADQALDPITDETLKALTLSSPLDRTRGSNNLASPAIHKVVRHLRRLHIQCTGVHCTDEVLLQMVDSWCPAKGLRGTPALTMEKFDFFSIMPVVDEDEIGSRSRRWQDAGLDVVIESFANSLP